MKQRTTTFRMVPRKKANYMAGYQLRLLDLGLAKVLADDLFSQTPASSSGSPGLPAELDAIVHRAMAKEPEKRFANASSFAAALEPLTTSSVSSEINLEARGCPPGHVGCEDAQACLAAWTRFDYDLARRRAHLAAHKNEAWRPLHLIMSCVPDDPI